MKRPSCPQVHSVQYDPNKRHPEFRDTLALVGASVFVAFFTFSKELQAAYILGFKRAKLSIGRSSEWLHASFSKLKAKSSVRRYTLAGKTAKQFDIEMQE